MYRRYEHKPAFFIDFSVGYFEFELFFDGRHRSHYNENLEYHSGRVSLVVHTPLQNLLVPSAKVSQVKLLSWLVSQLFG